MNAAPYLDLVNAFRSEAVLVAGVLLILTLDLLAGRKAPDSVRRGRSVALAAITLSAALALSVSPGMTGSLFEGMVMIDGLALAARSGIIVLALLVLLLSSGTVRLRNPAEYVSIHLLATCGLIAMADAQQLLLAFVALELASLSLYVLAGFDKTRPESAEAALKYFLFGGISAAFVLFGISLIYGHTGTLNLLRISDALARQPLSPLLLVALAMLLVGLGFKSALAPFHFWAPDVYEGAPAPSAGLIASASKLGSIVLFSRIFWSGLASDAGQATPGHVMPGWILAMAVMAAASLLLGNIGALAQANLRRLIAYSAISHAGALLLGLMSIPAAGTSPLFYYALTYGVSTAGIFGVLGILENAGVGARIDDLAGLSRRSPTLAACLFVFVLSLAGIPPLSGFLGKVVVFAAALRTGIASATGILACLAIAMSAVGLYYYVGLLKRVFVAAPPTKEPAGPIKFNGLAGLALVGAAAATIVLGVWPSLILGKF